MAARRTPSLARWRRDGLRRLASSRAATLAFIERLPEAEVLRPRTIGDWSVKDMLAHFMACDEETARRFQLIARKHGDRIKWFESLAEADRFNAKSVAGARRLGVSAVLRRMARARAEMIRRFERLPLTALEDPSHAYPVTEWLPAPGWSHELDHLDEIKSWWRSQRAKLRASR